jgi:hypothetical protein
MFSTPPSSPIFKRMGAKILLNAYDAVLETLEGMLGTQ